MYRFLAVTLSFVLAFSTSVWPLIVMADHQADRGSDPYGTSQTYPDEHRPTAEDMILDGLVMRPVSLVATAVGTGIFIVTLPFSALGGNTQEAGRKLVIEPAKYTFKRCLGCIHRSHDGRYR